MSKKGGGEGHPQSKKFHCKFMQVNAVNGQRPFGIFPKKHPFLRIQTSLRDIFGILKMSWGYLRDIWWISWGYLLSERTSEVSPVIFVIVVVVVNIVATEPDVLLLSMEPFTEEV